MINRMIGSQIDNQKSFYFVRHGETDWNQKGFYQGCNDIPLNQIGISQAREVASKCQRLGEIKLFSSPLQRALTTAQIIADQIEYKSALIHIPELKECQSEESARCILNKKGIRDLPSFAQMNPHPETIEDFLLRVEGGLNRVFRLVRAPEITPLIISHGGVSTALCELLRVPAIQVPNCGLVYFECRQSGEFSATSV